MGVGIKEAQEDGTAATKAVASVDCDGIGKVVGGGKG